ncbi:MAG: hypothetical protein M0Q53_05265 [Prolixibacteraceae bacterium]|jgi:hypothetical protein|nr:hypothetical protein [Prolixibacteraceae bacterium]
MSRVQLPSDGSVLIIDDKIDEALPIIKLLSKKGISTTYYSGKDSEIPEIAVQKIRLAFVDIQLFGPSDSHSYAQNILRILDAIIPDNNGPYILLIWSSLEDVHADALETLITSDTYNKKPVIIIRLEKSSFFKTLVDNSQKEELIETLTSSLSMRFPDDDLDAIKAVINENLGGRNIKEPVENAIDLITDVLKEKLKKANSFHLFTIWESLINKASGEIIRSFTALHLIDKYWEDNLKNSIYRLSHAQLGKIVDSVDEDQLLKNALKTINSTLLDEVERKIFDIASLSDEIKIDRNKLAFSKMFGTTLYYIRWRAKTGKFMLFVDGHKMPIGNPKETTKIESIVGWGGDAHRANLLKMVEEYNSISPQINTRLLFDLNPTIAIHPGNIFSKTNIHWNRKRNLLKNYFNVEKSVLFKKGADGKYIIKNPELKKIIFIELEVTPLCDFAQNKWRKSRLLPGIIYPQGYQQDVLNGENFYDQIPVIQINNTLCKVLFDFRFLKSIDINANKQPFLKIRNELFADILSRLSSHANRVGLTVISN